MKTINLNWQDLTEENVTKLYLYGDLNNTHDLTSKDIHREGSANDASSAQVTIELNNFYDYMSNPESPMRYANLSQIPVVDKFFNEKNTIIIPPKYPDIPGTVEMRDNMDRLQEGTYSLNEVREHFNDDGYPFSMQHMKLDPSSEDYDKRVYVFNSQAIHLGNEAQFVVKPNGERHIENAAPTIGSEDFDFVSKEPSSFFSTGTLVKAGNDSYLVPNIDPLGIGRTVVIAYPQGGERNETTGLYDNPPEYTQYIQDYAKAHGDYTKDKYEDDLADHEQAYRPATGLANVMLAMSRVVDTLWESNITKFVDNASNVMLFEKEGFDSVYDNNFNMQNYIQENKDVQYHLVDTNGTENFMEIARPEKEPFDSTAKAQEIINELYPHLGTNYENNITYDNDLDQYLPDSVRYSNESNDMYDNNDSYGMERD